MLGRNCRYTDLHRFIFFQKVLRSKQKCVQLLLVFQHQMKGSVFIRCHGLPGQGTAANLHATRQPAGWPRAECRGCGRRRRWAEASKEAFATRGDRRVL